MRSKLLIGGLAAAVAFLLATSPVVAQAAAMITSSDIVNGTIRSVDIKNGTIRGKDIGNGSVASSDVKDGSIAHKDLAVGPIGIARGYAWNNLPSPALGTPQVLDNGYTYNSNGGPITLERNATGVYLVQFTGLDWDPGNVQVSAYGSSPTWCNVGSWGSPTVIVRCFDATGAAADSLFTVTVFE